PAPSGGLAAGALARRRSRSRVRLGAVRRLALLAILVLSVPSAAAARTIRVFAVGPKFDLSWVDSRQHYHDKLFALLDARLRGAPGRSVTADTGGSTAAFASLLSTYAPVMAYYSARYPALSSRGVPARLAELALTDTLARTAVETFAELAARYHVYLVAGITM